MQPDTATGLSGTHTTYMCNLELKTQPEPQAMSLKRPKPIRFTGSARMLLAQNSGLMRSASAKTIQLSKVISWHRWISSTLVHTEWLHGLTCQGSVLAVAGTACSLPVVCSPLSVHKGQASPRTLGAATQDAYRESSLPNAKAIREAKDYVHGRQEAQALRSLLVVRIESSLSGNVALIVDSVTGEQVFMRLPRWLLDGPPALCQSSQVILRCYAATELFHHTKGVHKTVRLAGIRRRSMDSV